MKLNEVKMGIPIKVDGAMRMFIKNILTPGLHTLWYPGIRDTSTWSNFRAHGEHGDVFLFSNLSVL